MPYVCFGGFENYSSKQNRCEFFPVEYRKLYIPLERDYYIKNNLEISRFVNVYCFFITTKKAIHVVIMGGALQQELRWKPCQPFRAFLQKAGISIKIEVASRFAQSNRLHQQVACVASVSSRGSSRKLGQEQKKKMNDRGGGGFLFSPPHPPSTFFLLSLSVTFANNQIGNACYAG